MPEIIIQGARERNLKNVSLGIPREKLVVFTGLSGSGKSTLAIDVLYRECQRQYLEAMGLQGINKPQVDAVRNVSPAIVISQSASNKNPRSTVGTLTDIYTDLRMIYEKLSVRVCPQCNELISAAECREEVDKYGGQFTVYMYCSRCNHRMEKLTRTHFSHNTREGACATCQGLGKVLTIERERAVQESRSLEAGAVDFWTHRYGEYQIETLYKAFEHYGLPIPEDVPVAEFSDIQREILFHGVESPEVKRAFPGAVPPRTVAEGKFEGVLPTLWRRMSEKGGSSERLSGYFVEETCPDCHGERLSALSRSVTVQNTRLPQLTVLSLEELYDWIVGLETGLDSAAYHLIESYSLDLRTRIQRLLNVGLGYLSLERQTVTLSGGELQRVRLAAALDSDLMGIIYVLDEPTIGLHPQDTEGLLNILKRLRDSGNTVIVIEHDPEVMQEADLIVDLGPGAGEHGGEIVGLGTAEELKRQKTSVTGAYLSHPKVMQREARKGTGTYIEIRNADLHNLQHIDVNFPVGRLTTVTGVSGAGKSTLVFEVLAQAGQARGENDVTGLDEFDQVITIEQSPITRMRRSNVATYSEVYTDIRRIFGQTKAARDRGLTATHFSFNSKGGRCENCQGLGYVTSNMLFFEDLEVTCPVCGGKQFNDQVLSVKYAGQTIKDILELSVEEAAVVFHGHTRILRILGLLQAVGLGYLKLGQTLTTLSGGEGQRLKLARELLHNADKKSLLLLDEPTVGLHPLDVENFLRLLNRLVDAGNTAIVVEHNQQVIRGADWIIDLGPGGGRDGGRVVFAGTPEEMLTSGKSVTADCLRRTSRRRKEY